MSSDTPWTPSEDIKNWKIYRKGVTPQYNSPIVQICRLNGGIPEEIFFNGDKSKMMSVLFPIDPEGPKEKQVFGFLTTPDQKKRESYDVKLRVDDPDMIAYFQAIDSWLVMQAIQNPDVFFTTGLNRRAPTEQEIRVKCKPCLITPTKEGLSSFIKAKLNLTGPDFLKSEITIVDGPNKMKGMGWNFLKEHLGTYKLLNYYAIPAIVFRGCSITPGGDISIRLDIKHIYFINKSNSSSSQTTENKLDNLLTNIFGEDTSKRKEYNDDLPDSKKLKLETISSSNPSVEIEATEHVQIDEETQDTKIDAE